MHKSHALLEFLSLIKAPCVWRMSMLNVMLMSLIRASTKKSNAPRNIECHGCCRMFTTVSAMMIHLESGSCECGVNRDGLDRIAYECYWSEDYTNDWNDYYMYKCPDCQNGFRFLSALFQHIESDACNQGMDGASIAALVYDILREI